MLRLLIGLLIFAMVISLVTTAIKENWLQTIIWDGIYSLVREFNKCDHEPHSYNETTNTVDCECGKKKHPELSYGEFVDVLSFKQKSPLLSGENIFQMSTGQHLAKLYLTYRGTGGEYLDLVSRLPKKLVEGKDSAKIIGHLESCFDLLGHLTIFDEPYRTQLDGVNKRQVEFIDLYKKTEDTKKMLDHNTGKKWVCSKTLASSISIAGDAITAYKFLDATENSDDIETACKTFIDAVTAVTDKSIAPVSIYFTVMLDTLSYTLDTFFTQYRYYEFNQKVIDAAIQKGDDFFESTTDHWYHFADRANWEGKLEDVDGTEGVFGLPSVEEALSKYPEASEEGKQLLSAYIVFRLDRIFNKELGISYEEFITCLGAES